MKTAVTYDNGQVFQHFGHTETIKMYDVENDQVLSAKIVAATEGVHSEHQGGEEHHHCHNADGCALGCKLL